MKKLIAASICFILALCSACSPAYADPYDLRLVQSNSIDNGPVNRLIHWPTQDALFYFNPVTLLPSVVTLGSGLGIVNGVLNTAPQAGQVNADWNATSGAAQILNKPVLKTVALTGQAGDLTGLAPVALSGAYGDLTGRPALFSGIYAELTGKPTFAAVATTGNYNDLVNRPSIPAAQLPRAFAYRTPLLNTCFQLSSTRDVQVNYSIDVTATLTLVGGARGTVALRSYSDSACATGQQTLVSGSSGLPAALSVAIGLQNLGSVALPAVVPAGTWVRIETANDTGTPTFAARQGQEVQL